MLRWKAKSVTFLACSCISLSACELLDRQQRGRAGEAEVTSSTDVGGIVRFSGNMAGVAVDAAQVHCKQFGGRSALPISFYKIGSDIKGRDQIMTFECK